MTNEPRMRDLYQEYLRGQVTFEHLVEVANRGLARWEAEKAALEAEAQRSGSNESTS